MADYTYFAIDLASRQIKADLDLSTVTYRKQLNDHGTFQGSIGRRDRKTTSSILSTGSTIIVAARDGVVDWGGVLMKMSTSGQSEEVVLSAVGLTSLLERRYLEEYTAFSDEDQRSVISKYLAQAQDGVGGNLGLRLDYTGPSYETFTDEMPGGSDHKFMELITDLGKAARGFDWTNYVDQSFNSVLKVVSPRAGAKTSFVFDYGVNIADYNWTQDATATANKVIVRGNDTSKYGVANDFTAQKATIRLETVLSYGAIGDQTLLQRIAEAELKRRANALNSISSATLLPGTRPAYGTYYVGDFVRVIVQDGIVQVDGQHQIWEIEVVPGVSTETVTLTLQSALAVPDV